jgi:HK97 family phage prohead protease
MLQTKAFDDETREFEGIASTPTPDRMGDIVEPKGAQFKGSIPLLWQHDQRAPIGEVTPTKITDGGIFVRGKIFTASVSRALIERLDEAYESLKLGLVKGLSIGFQPTEYSQLKDGGYHFQKWDWLELSAVTIPANADASIQVVKSIDRQLLAASGKRSGVVYLGESTRRARLKSGVIYLDHQAE